MPKMKTHKGTAKRFRRTGTGKIMHAKAFKSHILTKKDTKRTRRLRAGGYADETNAKRIRSFRKEELLEPCDAKVVSQRMGK